MFSCIPNFSVQKSGQNHFLTNPVKQASLSETALITALTARQVWTEGGLEYLTVKEYPHYVQSVKGQFPKDHVKEYSPYDSYSLFGGTEFI